MKPTYHQQQQTAPDLSKIEFQYDRNKSLDNKFKHTQEQRKEIYNRAIDTQGLEHQYLVAIEELSELTTVLCKKLAHKPTTAHDLTTEIADCTIMLDIISYALVNEASLNDEIHYKLSRFKDRLDALTQNT